MNGAGRDVCGTTASGEYATYRYGVRWFGDYRGAIPGVARAFCIDLNYWYPSPKYAYRLETSATLVNRDGVAVSPLAQEKLAYAIWSYGRSSDASEDEAVMLYVHTLMGDARPGEADPSVLGADVVARFDAMRAASAEYHGPYRIVAEMPSAIVAGVTGVATVRVVSATGKALPNVRVVVAATGASGVPGSILTDAAGVGRLSLLPSGSAGGIHLVLSAAGLASSVPAVYRPTAGAAAVNGQRLAAPASQTVSASFSSSVQKVQLRVGSIAVPSTIAVGQGSHDRVTIAGASPAWRGAVSVTAYGPFATVGAIRCTAATAVWSGSIQAAGAGRFTVGPEYFSEPGWYVYREVVPGGFGDLGVSSNCSDPLERVQVQVQPTLHTLVSAPTVAPGAELSDTISVSGLGDQTATRTASDDPACQASAAQPGTPPCPPPKEPPPGGCGACDRMGQ